MMNSYEFVARGSDVEIRLFLIYKERVGYPNIPNEF